MIYKVETIKDGTEKYFFIRNLETMSIEELPSKYLMHKIKCKRSPNMPQRIAQANDKFFDQQESSLVSWLRKEEQDAK